MARDTGAMARVLLLRHGQSTWNAESRWQGQADPPLSPEGERQAGAAALLLADLGIAAVVSSPQQRALQTAEVVAEALGLGPVEIDADLRERHVGDWSGLTRADIDARWPGALDDWRAGQLHRPPGGEHHDDMAGRVLAALARLAGRPEPVVLAVTHGGVIHLVERHFGVRGAGVGNLCGRWLEAAESLGEAFLVDHAAPTTTL